MHKWLLFLSLMTAPTLYAESDQAPDRTGAYDCSCSSQFCTFSEGFRLSYDKERQFVDADGPKWNYSGYVSRQHSKTTGMVYLSLPRGYSIFSTGMVLSISPEGELKLDGEELSCTRI